jgi:di/tricarboxylate transporter
MNRSPALTILLVVLGIVCVALAIFYATTDTGFLAGAVTRHYKHAVAFAVAALVLFIGANFSRTRPAR